jgi:hypothetical protein
MTRRPWKASTWLRCRDPERMLRHARARGASERKVRLYLAACCRACWDQFALEQSRAAIEVAERYAEHDEKCYDSDFFQANKAAHRVPNYWEDDALSAICCLVCDDLDLAVAADEIIDPASRCVLLREVFAPAREPPAEAPWRNETVVSIAQAVYERRSLPSGELEPERLAVLADALTDAGCDDDDLLSHLRSAGPHVRGCWALDLVLGKE